MKRIFTISFLTFAFAAGCFSFSAQYNFSATIAFFVCALITQLSFVAMVRVAKGLTLFSMLLCATTTYALPKPVVVAVLGNGAVIKTGKTYHEVRLDDALYIQKWSVHARAQFKRCNRTSRVN